MKSRIVLFAFCLALLLVAAIRAMTRKSPRVCSTGITKMDCKSNYSLSELLFKGKQDVEILLESFGFITKLCVDEGATVRKGQVLFIVDLLVPSSRTHCQIAVATAVVAVSTQQMTYDNKKS